MAKRTRHSLLFLTIPSQKNRREGARGPTPTYAYDPLTQMIIFLQKDFATFPLSTDQKELKSLQGKADKKYFLSIANNQNLHSREGHADRTPGDKSYISLDYKRRSTLSNLT